MKDRIINLYKLVINRLPLHYKRDLIIFPSTEDMFAAYAKDIDSTVEMVTEWYINNYWNVEDIENSAVYSQPKSLENIPAITTPEYIMVSLRALKEKGNKEIIYLFLRELGASECARKNNYKVHDVKIRGLAKRWFNKFMQEGLLDEY